MDILCFNVCVVDVWLVCGLRGWRAGEKKYLVGYRIVFIPGALTVRLEVKGLDIRWGYGEQCARSGLAPHGQRPPCTSSQPALPAPHISPE